MESVKTYKREAACAALLFLAGLTMAAIGYPDSLAWEAAKHFTVPIFTFAGMAFGLDAYAKQIKQL